MSKLIRSGGRMLCSGHAKAGAPPYFYEGCEACIEARAKGIIRPPADSVTKRQRGRARFRERFIDWELARKVRAARGAQS
jgi:hypothetical protein